MTVKDLVPMDPEAVAELLGIAPLPVTPADMAWMAGVLDVKATMIRKTNQTRRTPQFVLYVQAKDARIAGRLSAMTGTAPEPHNRTPPPEAFMRRNCTEHCPGPHVHVDEDEHPWRMPETTRWGLTGIAAAVVLMNLAPLMTTYADYAGDVAVITGNFVAAGPGSGAVLKTLRRLSALGWPVPAAVSARIAEAQSSWGKQSA
jgi:hypothetical protein